VWKLPVRYGLQALETLLIVRPTRRHWVAITIRQHTAKVVIFFDGHCSEDSGPRLLLGASSRARRRDQSGTHPTAGCYLTPQLFPLQAVLTSSRLNAGVANKFGASPSGTIPRW